MIASPYQPSHDTGTRRVAAGLAVSLAVHAILLLAYRFDMLPRAIQPEHAAPLAVWIRPPQVKPPPEPPPPPKPLARVQPAPVTPRPVAARPRPAPEQETHTPVIAVDPKPAQTPPPDMFAVKPEPKPAFDKDAAIKLGAKLAREPDPARKDMPVAQLDKYRNIPQKDDKLEQGIQAAKKTDCIQNNGAGLLSPLIWMLDKHCKF